MAQMKPEHEWLGHLQPTGLVVSTLVLDELGLVPPTQDAVATAAYAEVLRGEKELESHGGPLLPDAWRLLGEVLDWPAAMVAGLPTSEPVPTELCYSLDTDTFLQPTYALKGPKGEGWQALVRVEDYGVDLDKRGALSGWEASPHQRFERLLRETGVGTGVLIGNWQKGEREHAELRLITAPRGETSGWISWPLGDMTSVAGRSMLGALKLLLGRFTLFNAAEAARLPALLRASREKQNAVSEELAKQVLKALYELLRGFDAAEPELVRGIATRDPHHLYEGLLTVLLRLVFVLYAEDRDLMPSRRDDGGLELYENGYAVRGLFARLENDAALNPDTMDERRGAWGQLLALFRLIHRGHASGFMQARGGKLFDDAAFPFLMGKQAASDPDRVPPLSDGCIHRVLESLMIVNGERLSYRTLDVEQIGSVYETVMGFTAQLAQGRSIAIKAGKNNKTPVYVDCDALLGKPAKEREKTIKETTGRGQFPASVSRGLKEAATVEAIEAALANIADERGSPRGQAVAAGTPILQPTDERRRTGSHYTPRSLTEPIVSKALEPAFARLGDAATPDEVLSLKVCDPACGSGAFLVEATRQIGTRLVKAWEAHSTLKPAIPQDEDDDLHARRLVAQRCIYGVDRNPMATDLAKLSLWLATLARDHEFSFLDHALKSGDSLVGLNKQQLSGGSWDNAPVRSTLIGQAIGDRVERLLAHREAIRNAPDDVTLAMQESRYAIAEKDAEVVRLIGDAIVAAFFKHAKPKARFDEVRYVTAMAGTDNWWDGLRNIAASLEGGEHPIRPFHWEIEFPEVFSRDNPGFDAIIGNPPFLGGAKIWPSLGSVYPDWLRSIHVKSAGKAVDLVAHFFRRSFSLIRKQGAMGLVGTKTISEGDTREAGLMIIREEGGRIFCAREGVSWPGEADVFVSIVHIEKSGQNRTVFLNGKKVIGINSFLLPSDLEHQAQKLRDNAKRSFRGCDVYGLGFIFSDDPKNGSAGSISEMRELIMSNPKNSERIFPFIGGKELTTDPLQQATRYAINFADMSYEEAEKWPDLLGIVKDKVKPHRDRLDGYAVAIRRRDYWWQYGTYTPALYAALKSQERVLAIARITTFIAFAFIPSNMVFNEKIIVLSAEFQENDFSVVSSRIHEFWALLWGTTLGQTPNYSPPDCFETFPFPSDHGASNELRIIGQEYEQHRGTLMAQRKEGLTKTYNRFHNPKELSADIVELRRLHAMMDDAVLRAYGWDDLADRAHPGDPANGIAPGDDAARFLTEEDEDDHKYQNRLFWPAHFRDELLARLLKLNEERAAAEKANA